MQPGFYRCSVVLRSFRQFVATVLMVATFLLAAAFSIGANSAVAGAPQPAEPAKQTQLRVAIKPLDPFVIRSSDGQYSGFSIDLWNEIADRNSWSTAWVWNEKVTDVLADVESDSADVGIAGITITKDREVAVDFSHPMFSSGLAIAAAKKEQSGIRSALGQVFSPRLLKMLAVLGIGIVVVGNIVWLTQFRRRPQTRRYRTGVVEGMWFAGKTLGSADFGDEEPTKPVGRLFALVWMFAGIIIIQYFTALTTTALTIQQIDGSIKGVQDLPGKRLVSVEGTTADTWLTEQGLAHKRVRNIELAYPELIAERADAIVFDAPVLLRWVATAGGGKARVAGPIFKPETYGIAVATGSPLREQINASLLDIQSDGTYLAMYDRWFQSR
jgi:polar amino acid transport system substrate-binding protein